MCLENAPTDFALAYANFFVGKVAVIKDSLTHLKWLCCLPFLLQPVDHMMPLNFPLRAAALAATLLAPMLANATNGYFSHGYGAKSQGIAGIGIALPQDGLAAATTQRERRWSA